MELILSPEANEYVSYIRTFHGIQVAMHSPEDFPDLSSPVLLQPGYEMKIFITPSVLTSDKNVIDIYLAQTSTYTFSINLHRTANSFVLEFQIKDLSESKRKCIFNDEAGSELFLRLSQ